MRVLPGSLKGQLIALTLVATILSQLASLLFVLDDHRSRIKNVWFHNVLGAHRNRQGGDRHNAGRPSRQDPEVGR